MLSVLLSALCPPAPLKSLTFWRYKIRLLLLLLIIIIRPSVPVRSQNLFPISIKFGVWVDLDRICPLMWPRPDPRSRSRPRSFRSCENCTFI